MERKEKKDKDEDLGEGFNFGNIPAGGPESFLPTDFELPDFSQVGKTLKMISWLPAIITSVVVLILAFLTQVIFYGLTQYDYNLTYGAFMVMILVSFGAGLISGALVKVTTDKKSKKKSLGL